MIFDKVFKYVTQCVFITPYVKGNTLLEEYCCSDNIRHNNNTMISHIIIIILVPPSSKDPGVKN